MRMETLDKLAAMSPFHLRDVCSGPWVFGWDGADHVLATDGRAMALVRGSRSGGAPMTPRALDLVTRYLTIPAVGARITLGRVKEWAGPAVWTADEPCRGCGGDGNMACPECPSRRCPYDHDAAGRIKCDDCAGSGRRPAFPRRLARLGGKWFNANYVACLVETCVDDAILIQLSESQDSYYHMAVLTGSGWRMWVMGFHPDGVEPGNAAAPDLELARMEGA